MVVKFEKFLISPGFILNFIITFQRVSSKALRVMVKKLTGVRKDPLDRIGLVPGLKMIGIRPLAPVQTSVSLKLMQRKTLNFVINLPDVENLTR